MIPIAAISARPTNGWRGALSNFIHPLFADSFRCDLVKGQHYSGLSGSGPFLDAVQPRLIIARSREFPERERISEEWANQVRARGIKLFRHDETGAVELKFVEKHWSARAYSTGEVFRSVSR